MLTFSRLLKNYQKQPYSQTTLLFHASPKTHPPLPPKNHPPLRSPPPDFTDPAPPVQTLGSGRGGEVGWSGAALQTQTHYLTGQTRSCTSRTHSQTVITVSKQARTVSGDSLDKSLVPITFQFRKMGSFIYFGSFRDLFSDLTT